MGGALAQCSFKRWSPDRVVRVRALADTVLCSWARHVTLVVLLSTQVYKWVPANSIKQNARPILRQGTLLLANISASTASLLHGQCHTEQLEIGTEKNEERTDYFPPCTDVNAHGGNFEATDLSNQADHHGRSVVA